MENSPQAPAVEATPVAPSQALVPVATNAGESPVFRPPYVAWGSFQNLLDRMQAEGLPLVVDRSYFGNRSGSYVSQMMSAMRSLDLIDESGTPTAVLREVIDPTTRTATLRNLLEERYTGPIELGRTRGTAGQLRSWFVEAGLTGQTADKATAFYLSAAEELDLPLSALFRRTNTAPGRAAQKRAKARSPRPDASGRPRLTAVSAPLAQPATDSEAAERFRDLVLKIAEKRMLDGDELDMEFLKYVQSVVEGNQGPEAGVSS